MTTDRTAVEYRIARIFEQELNLKVSSNDADLFEVGGLDSLSFVELLLQLERAYGIKPRLQELDLADFRSIGRIADFVRRRLDTGKAQATAQYMYTETKCLA